MNLNSTKLYINPEDFIAEYNKSLELGKPTEKLVSQFSKIAKGFSTTFHHVNNCDKNACINYAVMEAYLKWNKFNQKRSNNIFSFFTTMIANDMMTHYKYINRGKKVNISIDVLFSNNKNN